MFKCFYRALIDFKALNKTLKSVKREKKENGKIFERLYNGRLHKIIQ